jgi:hypothetical protein
MTAGQNQNCKLGAVDYCQNPVTVKQRLGLVEGEGSNFVNQCHQETAELFYVVLCLQPCQSKWRRGQQIISLPLQKDRRDYES